MFPASILSIASCVVPSNRVIYDVDDTGQTTVVDNEGPAVRIGEVMVKLRARNCDDIPQLTKKRSTNADKVRLRVFMRSLKIDVF